MFEWRSYLLGHNAFSGRTGDRQENDFWLWLKYLGGCNCFDCVASLRGKGTSKPRVEENRFHVARRWFVFRLGSKESESVKWIRVLKVCG